MACIRQFVSKAITTEGQMIDVFTAAGLPKPDISILSDQFLAEVITRVKKSVTIDRTLRESARAKIKVMVKRILNTHGYPPALQREAVTTVLAQAELLCAEWV